MRMRTTRWSVSSSSLLLILLFTTGASCGESRPANNPQGDNEGERATNTGAAENAETPTTTAPVSAEAIPLPPLPEQAAEEAPPRPAPTIGSLDNAEAALRAGFYDEVAAALPNLSKNGGAARGALLRARLLLTQGQYREAETSARTAAREARLRIAAETLRGEAQMARGALDEAERTLTPLVTEAGAHRAMIMLGRLQARRGRTVEAENAYMRLISAYNNDAITSRDAEGLGYVGMAAWGLDSAQDANSAFQESTRANSELPEVHYEWARLFFAKYDTGHAEESLNEALRINPNYPEALELMARVRIDQAHDFVAAEELIGKALAVNENLVSAYVTSAGIALRDLDTAQANQHIGRALAIDDNDLEALSVRAGIAFLAGDDAAFDRAKQEVLRRHSTYSEMYTIISEYAEWEHRYPDMVAMAREATQLNSRDARAHATLGINLLRMGEEADALAALREAWRRDRFNVRVFNSLNLYDDVIPVQYEEFPSGPFVFRMHKEERPILERYVPPTLTTAYADMQRRYSFTPEGPVRIEMFADPQHFSVRTVGLPNLGVQGVCFGKVVTALSPRGGPFNWAQITWHELAHVFHIQLSQNTVPRWFTEGLAEYETIIARPEWRREMDHVLADALANDALPPLRLMNRAFTRAKSGNEMITAYYASSQIVKYIAETHGFDDVVAMLRGWAAGHESPRVVQDALGVSIDDLDAAFRAHSRQRLAARANDFRVDFGRYRELEPLHAAAQQNENDANAQAEYAAGLLAHGQAEPATQAATRAIQREENQPIARFVLARIALATGNGSAALGHLRAIIAGGKDGYEVRLLLARGLLAAEDKAGAKRELEAAVAIDGDRKEAWQGLYEIAQSNEDADGSLRALTRLAELDEHNRAYNATLLSKLEELGRWDDVLRFGEIGVHVDPARAETHRLLGEAYARAGRGAEALREMESATLANHEAPGRVHLGRARAHLSMGDRAAAEEAVRAATQSDASLAADGQALLNP